MNKPQPVKSRSMPGLVRLVIFAVLTVALACGGVLLFFYLIGGYQHDRAAGVAAWASGEIGRLSEQVLEAAPEGATLTSHQQVRSGVRRHGLSDGSLSYASASARQDYSIQLGLNTVLAHYDQLFASWGWDPVPLNFYTDNWPVADGLQRIYRHPDNENLLVELCQYKPTSSSGMMQYHVFLEFDEIPAMIVVHDGTYKHIHNYCEYA